MDILTSRPQVLHQHGFFANSSDLWLCSEPKTSKWAQKLDWYLNFQMTKAYINTPRPLHESLEKWIEEHNFFLEGKKEVKESKALLFSGAENLPCQQLIVQKYTGEPNLWLKKLIGIAGNLNSQFPRIFLPDSLSSLEAIRKLNEIPESINFKISLVPGRGEYNRKL